MITVDSIEDIKLVSKEEYNVNLVNSIAKKYPKLRSKSKAPTFLLQYGGTAYGLQKQCGFTEEEAKSIEDNYHELYKVSDEWIKNKLLQACDDGYVTLAFGLRLRTPLLKQSILGTTRTLKQAQQESRTAGNALSGQSYGLLNNRAAIAFMERVYASKYKYDIRPVALIHDAIYLVITDDIDVIHWTNQNLIECMSWQELPELQHDDINLEAELDIYYPNWANAITLSNNITKQELENLSE